MKAPKPCWLHVDINSYFATLLQQENPMLRGRPVGIVKDLGRTCVIAASKEAKQLGVGTGTNIYEAKRLAPNIVFLPAEFARYLDATKRLKNLFSQLVPDYEIFSLDEVFLDFTHSARLYPSAHTLAQKVQQQIFTELGEFVSCNVGISKNRFLAKMAGETGPKGSITEITESNLDHYLQTTEFKDVCGVGHGLEKRLARIGITSLYALNFVSDDELQQFFGPYWSQELRKMGMGEEPSLFQTHAKIEMPKSVSRSITGFRLSDSEFEIRAVIRNLIDEVMFKAREMHLAGRWASLSLTGSDHQNWWAHQKISVPIRHADELFTLLYHGLYKNWNRSFPIIRWRIVLADLNDWDATPQPWLPDWQRQEALAEATHMINKRFGLFTLRSGALLQQPIIRPEVTGYLGDKRYLLGE